MRVRTTRSLLEHPVALERFDYARVGEHVALLRVVARLSDELGEPSYARLRVTRSGQAWDSFSSRGCQVQSAADDAEAELIWRGLFMVPFALVGQPEFGFELVAPELPALALPRPTLPGTPMLSLPTAAGAAGLVSFERLSHVTGARLRTGAVAVATALAVSSTPTLALADGSLGLSSHAQATGRSIERHAQRAHAAGQKTHPARLGPPAPPARQALRRGEAKAGGLGTLGAPADHKARHQPNHTHPSTANTGPIATTDPVPMKTAPRAPTKTAPPATVPTTPPAPTAPVPTTTAPAPSGGSSVGTPDAPAPAPAPVPVPTTAPIPAPTVPATPPLQTRSNPQPTSHVRAPSHPHTPRSQTNGGSSVRPRRHHHRATRPAVQPGSSAGASAETLAPTPPGFSGPQSWTGSVTTDPALTGALGNLAGLLANGNRPPRFLIPIYMEAGRRYHVPWPVLAAINAVESDYGRNLNTSSAGAIGWMQFEPGTWKAYGLAVDGHSIPNPYDPRDAIFSAARYLGAAGAATDVPRAIFAYNHAGWYVDMVLTRARAIAAGIHPHTRTGKHGVVSAYFATWRGHWRARYQGGVLSHYVRLIAAANMVSAANFPYVWGGGHEQPARWGPFDCSGSVSYVMQQAGYKLPTSTSGDISAWKLPAGPGRVTIFYNPGHTFMRIGHRYFGTSGFARPGGGAGWFSTDTIPESYLATFNEVHVPRLGANSFVPGKHRKQPRHGQQHRRGSHTAPAKHPRYLPPVTAPSQLRPSFPSVLQMTFPST